MFLPHWYHGVFVDLPVERHTHKLPGARREDAIKIRIMRDGTFYFGYSRVAPETLPELIRGAVRHGAEKRIYLEVDARALYRDVNALLPQIQKSGIQNVSLIANSPRLAASPVSLPTP